MLTPEGQACKTSRVEPKGLAQSSSKTAPGDRSEGADRMVRRLKCRTNALVSTNELGPRLVGQPEVRSPSLSATACSWFIRRVRVCTIRCRCHSSCRRSRFSQLGSEGCLAHCKGICQAHRRGEVGAARSAPYLCPALPCFGRRVGADPIPFGARFGSNDGALPWVQTADSISRQ